MSDAYITAYDHAHSVDKLEDIAAVVGIKRPVLCSLRTRRWCVGHERATRIYYAMIQLGCLPDDVPMSDLFPSRGRPYVPKNDVPVSDQITVAIRELTNRKIQARIDILGSDLPFIKRRLAIQAIVDHERSA